MERACAEINADVVILETDDASKTARDLMQSFVEVRGRRPYDVLLVGSPALDGRVSAPPVPVAGATR